MILFLNTTEREQAELALIGKNQVHKRVFKSPGRLSEKLPLEVKKMLSKHKMELKDIKKIAVVRGPGSFIGTRTGVAFANALSWALNVPIAGILADESVQNLKPTTYNLKPVLVKYSAPPNITKPRESRIVYPPRNS